MSEVLELTRLPFRSDSPSDSRVLFGEPVGVRTPGAVVWVFGLPENRKRVTFLTVSVCRRVGRTRGVVVVYRGLMVPQPLLWYLVPGT